MNPTKISDLYVSQREDAGEAKIPIEGLTTNKLMGYTFKGGAQMYVEGATFPKAGFPTPEAIYASNQVKKTLIEAIRLLSEPILFPSLIIFIFLPRKSKQKLLQKLLDSFNKISWTAMSPFIIKPEYMMPFTKELANLVAGFLQFLGMSDDSCQMAGKVAAHIFEYDDAYRYRVQDVMNETTISAWKYPRNEIKRLTKVYISREKNPHVILKAKSLSKILSILLWSTWLTKAIHEAMWVSVSDLKNLQMSEADWYWSAMKSDYLYEGKTKAENQEISLKKGYTMPTEYPI